VKLVVGLGNPGERYAGTRHNAGFMVADRLHAGCRSAHTSFDDRFDGRLARVSLEGQEVLLLKPQTFMNRSGRAVASATSFHGLGPEDLLVVHDDLDLDFGTVRVKVGGGSGGHRGLESCFEVLGTREFARVRVGIGRPGPDVDPVDYVLSPFDEGQRAELEGVVDLAADAAREVVGAGPATAMNHYNRRGAKDAKHAHDAQESEPETP
jgi:peptidyl-tRNA hydrolase, PTH1 family